MRTTKLAGLTALSLVLFACGGDDADGTSNTTGAGVGAGVLVKGSPSPADGTCPNGGTKIEVGADKNGNGQLDSDEVTGSQVVCSAAAPVLTSVTPSGPSAKCTNGGQTVKSGADTNGNGKLDDAEVTTTEEICGGGTNTELANSTDIAEGDARCPFGGKSTDVGYDNGANGAVAGDGVLQQGEVLGTIVSCLTGATSTLVPPSGPAGTSTITNSGGNGLAGAGGDAGNLFNIGTYEQGGIGLGGGNVKIWKTGTLDVDVVVPAVTPSFGATKMDVVANKTIASYSDPADAADGEYYLLDNNGLYYRQNAANADVVVTGVHIAPNVTLTLPPNSSFSLSDDLHNEGELTTGFTGNDRGNLQVAVARFIGAAGSKLTFSGKAQAGAAGGGGGGFGISAQQVFDQSTVDISGAPGDAAGAFDGGPAGTFVIQAAPQGVGPIYHVGSIKATGGASKATGGNGGSVQMVALGKGIFVKGDIEQSGGVGKTGGNAGQFVAQGYGDIVYRGNRTGNGGDVDEAACGADSCSGGAGAQAGIVSLGGAATWSGNNIGRGGKSKNAVGGAGGYLVLGTVDGQDPVLGTPRPAKNVRLAGTWDARGGDGATGGTGGIVLVVAATQGMPNGQEVELFGYANLESNGGTGTTGGGAGGFVTLQNRPTPNGITGGLAVYPNVSAKGGAASVSGNGGGGGRIQLLAGAESEDPGTIDVEAPAAKSSAVVAMGSIDASGGNGFSSGGEGGVVDVRSRERVDLFGAVTATGGGSTGANGTAGSSQLLEWIAGSAFNIASTVTVGGGSSTGATSTGGFCGGISVVSGSVKASAALTCNGGNSTGAAGGSSDGISLTSSQTSTTYTTLTANGGTGTTAGANGAVTVDGNTL